ncbi:hypothetical protein PSCICE_36490 [Pseudomonas cichorii]|nr:hypothetical protein PSCICE_36490 [Pseudomonas cichorii]
MKPTVTIGVKVGKYLEKIEISSRFFSYDELLWLLKGVYCWVIVWVEAGVNEFALSSSSVVVSLVQRW